MVDRDVVMVAEDGVQDLLAGFPVALGQLGADLGMAALHFMIGRLADIVQQAATPRQLAVQSELFRHHAAQVRDFQAVLEHVLTVTGSKLQPAEKLHELFMDRVHADVEDGLLAELENVLLHLLLRLLDNLLDARGMDAAVLNQLAQRETGDLAADIIKRADDHDAGRIVHDDIDTRALLEGADVAALAADDPAFHIVAGNVDRADGRVGRVGRRIALDRADKDLAGLLLGRAAKPLLGLLDAGRDLVAQFHFQSFQEHPFRLLPRQRADLMQLGRFFLDSDL